MISIIVPLYNKEKTILRTINKILKQTYSDYEILIIDDGSTDNSVKVINENIQDSRLRIICQDNGGVSSARNTGAHNAQGDWMVFLDADDYWLPNFLEEMSKAIIQHPEAKIIGCASYVVDEEKGKIRTNRMIDNLYDKCEPLNFFLNPDIMSHIGASVIKRSEFLLSGGFRVNLKNNEDILLIGSIVMNGGYFYLGKMLHVYSIGVAGQATRNPKLKEKFMKDSLYVINEFYNQYQSNLDNKKVTQALCYRYRDFLYRYLRESNYSYVRYFIDNVVDGFRVHTKCGTWMKNPKCRVGAILYIMITKMLWRLYGIQSRSHHSIHDDKLKNLFHEI